MSNVFSFFESHGINNMLIFAIPFSGVLLIAIINQLINKRKPNGCSCPIAQSSYLQNIKEMSKEQFPLFLIEMANKSASNTYFLRFPIPSGGLYVVGDPPTMRAILQDSESDKPAFMYESINTIVGNSNIASYSTKHPMLKAVRKCVLKSFSAREIMRMNDVCDKHVNKWIENDLEHYITEGKSFDPSEEMVKLTFDLIMESAFEYTNESGERDIFMENLEKSGEEFDTKEGGNPFRAYCTPFLKDRREAFKASKDCRKFVQKVIDTYRMNPNKSEQNTIIKLILNNKEIKTEKERVANIFTMMIAGFDTTGFTISSTLILLAKHPHVAEKLRKELLQMEPEDWSKSPYLRCVLQESKRLLPVAALGGGRTTSKDFIVKRSTDDLNFTIPKGVHVIFSYIASFRDPATFNDPESFYPERWETENVTTKMKDALIPFSLGSRSCVGQRLAVSELYSTIPKLVTKYDFEIEVEGELYCNITFKYKGSRLRATRAKN